MNTKEQAIWAMTLLLGVACLSSIAVSCQFKAAEVQQECLRQGHDPNSCDRLQLK